MKPTESRRCTANAGSDRGRRPAAHRARTSGPAADADERQSRGQICKRADATHSERAQTAGRLPSVVICGELVAPRAHPPPVALFDRSDEWQHCSCALRSQRRLSRPSRASPPAVGTSSRRRALASSVFWYPVGRQAPLNTLAYYPQLLTTARRSPTVILPVPRIRH
jgi:hypothetical protein